MYDKSISCRIFKGDIMDQSSKICDWCGKEVNEEVFKIYNGMRIHCHCYEEYKEGMNDG